jgi:SAM-dependent methyltransferase
MRVLELGIGVGNVAMLVAETVGPKGAVVGIDAEERAVKAARRRSAEAGLSQIEFVVGADQDLEKLGPFGAAIGRMVLIHQPDPDGHDPPNGGGSQEGGIIAFLEGAPHIGSVMMPELPIIGAASESVSNFMRVALSNYDVAGRIIPCFLDAGLPEPRVLWEAIVAGSDTKYLRWFVLTYQTFLPIMERFGAVNPAVGDPATLYERALAETNAMRARGTTPPYASAWAIRP